MTDTAIASCLDVQIAETLTICVGLLEFVHVETGIVGTTHLHHLCCEKLHAVHCMVAEEDGGVSTLLKHDKHSSVDHHVDIGAKEVDNLQRFFDASVARHINEQSILCKCRVESRDRVFDGISQPCVVFLHEFGIALRSFLQGANYQG